MNPVSPAQFDWSRVRERLARSGGQQYWRSLDELADTPEFREMLSREFPAGATEWWDGLNRRNFLKLAAASLALAGVTACTRQPVHQILPYIKQPEELVLGEPLFYATSMVMGGFATGALVKSREGHPIKIEGNPQHPSSLGASSVWMQASILDLYDPDRSQSVARNGDISTWALFLSDLNELLAERSQPAKAGTPNGAGLRFLTETITSPTLAGLIQDCLKKFPNARWHQFDPVTRDNVREGSRLAFGELVETHYHFDQAAVILSLESDFLYAHPERMRYARHFADGRRLSVGKTQMNRLYVVESTPTITGSMADHRLPISSHEVGQFVQGLAQRLTEAQAEMAKPAKAGTPNTFLDSVARDLAQHRGKSIVIAGEWQPAWVHALVHVINDKLGNTGKTVSYAEPAEASPVNQFQSCRELVNDMEHGAVETLFILGGNPVFTAPADWDFAAKLKRVRRSIHVSTHLDETSVLCTWHIPQTHYLEAWGDARSYDGTVSLVQPLIAPLYGGKSAGEILGALLQQQPIPTDYTLVRDHWSRRRIWPDFEAGWRRALHDGFIKDSAAAGKQPRLQARLDELHKSIRPEGLELCFRPDASIWDGSFANNGWLQECPKPISKLTWDNAALVSPHLAQQQGLHTGDVVELQFDGRKLECPALVMPGQAENSVTLPLGFGRWRAGRVGSGVGFNAYALRTSASPWFGSGLQIRKTGGRHALVATQTHHSLENPERQIYRAGTLREFLANSEFVKRSVENPEPGHTLYNTDEYPYSGHKWGMSIDLTTCIGCNACVVACEVENNIPVVGKEQVARNREMLWLRVDTYFEGSVDNPSFNHMPVPCMHCEHAPCELVCPVAATVHDHEGLNLQVYNRCVGTRFCSNNCPYKVRRFNFFQYAKYSAPSLKPMCNPEVTVRWRGVMEKCTYCIQRISAARIASEKENRPIRDGEVRTACQQACPAEAIIFGDLNDAESRIAKLKRHPLDYSMLGELNTRPRTTYLAKVRNPAEEKPPLPAKAGTPNSGTGGNTPA